jgi:S-adenosylmethionine decarboxylase
MTGSFGYSYLLDMYGCRVGAADDLELHYRFLESLVDRLEMTKMSAPIVMHGPRVKGIEQFPDKAGVSGWVPLIESGIQIHSIEPARFITLDVYSCREFRPEIVSDFAAECFGYESHEDHFLKRGVKYRSAH